MPGWRMSTSRNEMPLCFGASGSVRASVKMWSARWPADVQIFCPLSTHWSPSSSRLEPEAAEVGAGVGLGVALAPRVLAGQDARDVVLLLLLGAPHEQRVAEHLDAEAVVRPARRHAGPGELLGQDHLLERRQPGAAVLDGPAGGEVAGLVQRRAPRRDEVPGLVVGQLADARPVASAASRPGTPAPCRGRRRPRDRMSGSSAVRRVVSRGGRAATNCAGIGPRSPGRLARPGSGSARRRRPSSSGPGRRRRRAAPRGRAR